MAFLTRLDYSDNRQIKQHPETFTALSGGTIFGVPFSALTSGPDLTTTGITQSFFSVISTFSGNSGTTNYTWYDSRMSLGESALSALTPSNSGITQNTGNIFIAGGGSNILGAASSFVFLAGTSITNGLAAPRLVNGNTGHISTLTAPFTYTTGSDVAGNGPLNGGVNPPSFTLGTPLGDAHAALSTLSALTPTYSFAPGAINLAIVNIGAGVGVFTAGTYNISGAASIGAAGITLSGSGQYTFQITGALTTVSASIVSLSGGAISDNVYWVPEGGASLGASTTFVGNILSGPAAITTGLETIIDGRLISESAITIGGGTPNISIPSYSGGSTTIIDGNTVVLTYAGVSFDITVTGMTDLGSGNYSGTVVTSELDILSASTLDFTGRTIWVDVQGITRTEDLIITNNPVVGNVWTCIDSEGKGAWGDGSSSSGGTGATLTKYVTTVTLTSGITSTITHSLGTTDILTQVIDLTTNALVNVTIDNYLTNSVDITSNVTMVSTRIIIL